MESNFYRKRRGCLEHLEKGYMDWDMYVVFDALLGLADYKTGSWRGNAAMLAAKLFPKPIVPANIEQVQKALKNLRKKEYLGRGKNQETLQDGKTKVFTYWIDKFVINKYRVNASASALAGKTVFYSGEISESEDEASSLEADMPSFETPNSKEQSENPNTETTHSTTEYPSASSKSEEIATSNKYKEKIDRKKEAEVTVSQDPNQNQLPHEILANELLNLLGHPKALVVDDVKRHAREVFENRVGLNTQEAVELLRAAIGGECDTPQWSWSRVITTANYPMMMFAKKLEKILAKYEAAQRQKRADAAKAESPVSEVKPKSAAGAAVARFLKNARKL